MHKLLPRLPLAALLWGAIQVCPPRAAGQSLVAPSCPRGLFRGFLPDRDAFLYGEEVCLPRPVSADGRVTTSWPECKKEPAQWTAPLPPSVRYLEVLQARRYGDFQLRAGKRVLLRFSLSGPVLCIGGIYVSADRTVVVIEALNDKKRALSEFSVAAFKLQHPLPAP